MSADSIHIAIAPETIAKINLPFVGGFEITNAMLGTIIITVLLCVFAVVASFTLKSNGKPSKLQNALETFFVFIEDLSSSSLGSKSKARKYLGLAITLFLFIVLGSWFGLLPGVMHILVPDLDTGMQVPLLRAPTTDLNATLALALIAVLVTQVSGFMALGFGYLGKFFTIKGGVMGSFIGILELISELSRILSYSFRLFGNIFAGEVLLTIIFYFTKSYWLPFPTLIILMETVVAMIQGYVFISLMTLFINLAVTSHDTHDHKTEQSAH
jgi:F-type H+-transporting ATPase subunit a